MILLTISSERVRNTIITNEQGQAIYKTDTPFRLGTRTTTIQKIKPNDNRDHMHDQFDVLGEIEWHTFVSSKFRFHGTEVNTEEFIPKRGLWDRKRVFTGPDGRPYRWDLKSRVVVLSRDDTPRTEVARSHRATLGIIGRKRKAKLEVSPEVAHMMDTVIMTFIYVEQLRRNKEQAARSAAVSA
ncbi:uncharacterized protein F5147DRAFT_574421 [Suillus discolor]|uniref:DUF6593 domain-containing protein n=1 Tax=Suillus discolor TaxID=1912936 RepID=A0A9P7F8U3_9AGAM|nr:uncharacterized protein F5147DRAFT_574421 [Suillus discolor]KAG2110580.1 hypothetical protein F5147DRAFT_574421 [Suillus discolor]